MHLLRKAIQHILSFYINGHAKFDAEFVGLIWHVLGKSASSFGRKKLLNDGNVGTRSIMLKTIFDKGIPNC